MVPDNPFYMLKHSEFKPYKTEHEDNNLTKNAINLLHKLHYSLKDYNEWNEERWYQSFIKNKIYDMHKVEEFKPSFLDSLRAYAI